MEETIEVDKLNGAVGGRRRVWCVITSVDLKDKTESYEQQAADERKCAAKVCDGILTLNDENLIPSASRGEPKVFYYKTDIPCPRGMEEQASKLDGNCAAQAREWKELRGPRYEELVTIRDTNKLLNDCDELIPKWLNLVKDDIDSEDILLNIYREILQQNKIFRVIKMNLAKKYLEMLAEIAEKKDDDYKKFYEQFGERLKLGIHKSSNDGVEIAELLRFITSKPGDEQISFKEYVDRMKEGQNDICCITDESIAVVSSSKFRENLRKKGYEVPYMADPVDELAVQQPKEFDGTKPKPTTKEGLDPGDQDEEKAFEELMKETLGGKVEEAIVNDRSVDSLRAHVMSEHADTKRIMKAQAPRDNSMHFASGSQQQLQAAQQERAEGRKAKSEKVEGEEWETGVGKRRKEDKRKRKCDGREKVGAQEGEERERDQEGKKEAKERERSKQVEKDVMDWTVVTRNKRQRKMTQIFVKVNGSKATPMEVNLTNDKVEDVKRQIQKDEDVYVTMHGKVQRRDEKLKSCGVSDGCTIQVTSRLRGGGKHKDKKDQKERKRAAKQKGPEQKSEEEPKRDKGPAIHECDRDKVVQMIEESEENRKVMVQVLEENEDNRKMIESICEGSDVEVEQAQQNYMTAGREVLGWDQGQADLMERGLRWAVEARRKERREGREQHEEARFREKEQSDEMSMDEQNAMSGPEEAKTGRGRAGLVPGGG